MKPFDLEKAKAGKPVCTRDGKPVRILCYDRVSVENYCIVALIKISDNFEDIKSYPTDGHYYEGIKHNCDLMMAPVKHEGWVNVYKSSVTGRYMVGYIFDSEEQAKPNTNRDEHITTVKIEWEE